MSSKNCCRNCGSFDLETDPHQGDTVCTVCGIVLEDSVIVSEVQFEENAHGGSSAIGQFVSADAKGASMTVIGSFNYGMQKESKEITIQKARNELSRMCQLLRINQHCLDTALNFYKMALNRNLTKGRRSSLVCAACLYIACRLDKTPHLLIDFSDVLQVDPFTLGRTFTSITQDLYITLPLIDPCLYVLRYANQMKLGDKTQEVYTTALRVLQRMKRDFLHCGRRPSGLCGSALIIAARFHNIPKKLKDIVNIVHIQETTLRKRLIEFGDTPSSSLTTDEFFTVDLGEEQDPPSFKTARLKDKERLQKYSDVEYEMKIKKLQRLIEKELEKKRTRGKRSHSISSMDSEVELSSVGSPGNEPSDLLKDIIEDTLDAEKEINRAVAQSTVDIITNVCGNLKNGDQPESSSSSKGIGPTFETIGMNLNTSQSEQSKSNDKDNDENVDDESKIDDVDLNCMDDIDDEELDSYIVTEDEFKKKKKAWLKLYAAYLEEQKRKEEERLEKEKEEGKPDSKKKKRPRKNKSTGAATAGEAAEKVLREKKISNKLNYDVLKSLNVDDFIKSMNFSSASQNKDSLGSNSLDEDSCVAGGSKEIDEPVAQPSKLEKVSTDVAENDYDDDYDENEDYEEVDNEESSSVLKLSNILRGTNEDEDYDDYDY